MHALEIEIVFLTCLVFVDLSDADVTKAQLGLGHSFSRSKCAQDVNRQDKPITQTIALIE